MSIWHLSVPSTMVRRCNSESHREHQVYTKTADKEKGEQGYLWTSDGAHLASAPTPALAVVAVA